MEYLLTRSGTFRSTSHHRRFEIKARPGTTTETRKDCGCSCNEKINCAALVRPRITTDAYPFPGAFWCTKICSYHCSTKTPRFYPTCLKTRTHFDLLSSFLSYVMLLYPFNERKYLNERNIIITRKKKLDAQRWDTRKLPRDVFSIVQRKKKNWKICGSASKEGWFGGCRSDDGISIGNENRESLSAGCTEVCEALLAI